MFLEQFAFLYLRIILTPKVKNYFFPIVLLFVLVGSSLAFYSCKEIDQWTRYDVSFFSDHLIEENVLAVADSNYLVTGEFFLSFESELKKRAIKEKQIEQITLEGIELTTLHQSIQTDFSFVDSFEFILSGPGVGDRILVKGDSIRSASSLVNFTLNDKNGMEELLKSNSYKVLFRFKLNKPVAKELKMRIRTMFEIDAKQFFI